MNDLLRRIVGRLSFLKSRYMSHNQARHFLIFIPAKLSLYLKKKKKAAKLFELGCLRVLCLTFGVVAFES